MAVSLLLLSGVACLWARSYWRDDDVFAARGTLSAVAISVRGHVILNLTVDPDGSEAAGVSVNEMLGEWDGVLQWDYSDEDKPYDAAWLYERPWQHPLWNRSHHVWLGFHSEAATPPPRAGFDRYIYFPDWFLAALCGVLPARAWRRWRAERRTRMSGRCLCCGYDLRATPGRCPECGAVASGTMQT